MYEATFIDRQQVLRVLYEHVWDKQKVHVNKRMQRVQHSSTGVTVQCTDGTAYEGDVLLGADGVYSAVRQEMWRLADEAEPGVISDKERNGMS